MSQPRLVHLPAMGMLLILALLAPPGAAALSGDAACSPWPGEIDPLPTAEHPDPFLAGWAARRAEELAVLAEGVQEQSRTLAMPIWLHAACLDPRRGEFVEAARIARPIRVHRPPVLTVAYRGAIRPTRILGDPLRVHRPVLEEALRDPVPPTARSSIREAEQAIGEARFSNALEWAEQARAELDGVPEAAPELAQLEVLAATAALGLGQETEAQRSLAAALEADPDLRLDPKRVSPKIVALLEELRASLEEAPR
jgi:hypothetical protein